MTDFSILWFRISPDKMYIVAIAWLYVVLMMAVAEAMSPQGTVLGAFFTLLLYGVAPLALVLYILGTPGRKRRRARDEALLSAAAPDGGGEAAGDPVAPVGKEP
jgi:membrane protein implicated in regulation of membrane protease activity